jgi:hypothetical protein
MSADFGVLLSFLLAVIRVFVVLACDGLVDFRNSN